MEYHITADTTIGELMHEDSSDELVLATDMTLDELEHHGIKGMKWGVRRYQNRDGSLTAAGQKRRAKLETELKKLDGKQDGDGSGEPRKIRLSRRQKKALDKIQKQRAENLAKARQARIEKQKAAEEREKKLEEGKLPISKMTDAEIQARIDRIKLENSLKELMKEPVNPSTTNNNSNNSAGNNKTNAKSSKGKEVVQEILSNSAKNIGTQTVTLLAGTGVNKLLASVFNDSEMTVNPKKGQKDK